MRCFNELEKPEICYPVEHIVSGLHVGAIEREFAEKMLFSILNERLYDISLARNVNFREQELSSASWPEFVEDYRLRLCEKDGDENIERIRKRKPIYCVVSHEIFMELAWFRNLAENLNVVELIRNPLEVVLSWEKKDWGSRYISDQRSWRMVIEHKGYSLPWYLKETPHAWRPNISDLERIALTVAFLTKKQIEKVSLQNDIKVFFTQDIFAEPEKTIMALADWLELTLRKNWLKIIQTHNVPRPFRTDYNAFLAEFKKRLSLEAYQELTDAFDLYLNFYISHNETQK